MNMKFVFESSGGHDLFTAKSLLGLCKAEQTYILSYVDAPCPVMSVPWYVTLLSNKTSCRQITDQDVQTVRRILSDCSGFYHNSSLKRDMPETAATALGIPPECTRGGYVFNLLHHFTDVHFYGKDRPDGGRLKYALAYLRPYEHFDEEQFYRSHIDRKDLDNGVVKMTAVGLSDWNQDSTKFSLFNYYLMNDLTFFMLAAALILILMIFYLQSLSLLIATLFNVFFSFVLAYFVYSAVFGVKFFPFINILGLLILIAVGADDVFVFYDSWQQAMVTERGPATRNGCIKGFFTCLTVNICDKPDNGIGLLYELCVIHQHRLLLWRLCRLCHPV